MKTIYKYQVPPHAGGYCYIELPRGAQVLSAGAQGPEIFIWAFVDTEQPMTRQRVAVVGTGFNCDGGGRFVNTVFMAPGLVWHVFDYGQSDII